MVTLDKVNASNGTDPHTDRTPGPAAADTAGPTAGESAATAVDRLDLRADPVELTAALIDIPSVSRDEARIADAVEAAVRGVAGEVNATGEFPAITVERVRHNIIARTNRGFGQRVILAGHLDTVPIADNVPSRRGADAEGRDTLFGCGAVDMKSGDAVYLHAFAMLAGAAELTRDLTLIMYEAEEIEAKYNGLKYLAEHRADLLEGDIALLGEPSGNVIEAGCQGIVTARVTARGTRAHAARSWLGDNAVNRLLPVLDRVAAYTARTAEVDGLTYREGLQIVRVDAGVALNVIPDEATAHVNFRYAPDRTADGALAHLGEVLAIDDPLIDVEIVDAIPGAAPGLSHPAARELVEVAGGVVKPKFGWTDVSRFAAMGVPAVNFGPGDPAFCHKRDEQIPVHMIGDLYRDLHRYLTTPAG